MEGSWKTRQMNNNRRRVLGASSTKGGKKGAGRRLGVSRPSSFPASQGERTGGGRGEREGADKPRGRFDDDGDDERASQAVRAIAAPTSARRPFDFSGPFPQKGAAGKNSLGRVAMVNRRTGIALASRAAPPSREIVPRNGLSAIHVG